MTAEQEQLYWRLAFASLRGLTLSAAREILSLTGSEHQFFEMGASRLSAVLGMRSRLISDDNLERARQRALREMPFVSTGKVRAVYFADEEYPRRLEDCADAPLMLFTSGDASLNPTHSIAVVGTRHATPYGIDFVKRMVRTLADKCIDPPTIISGLALGIDIAAHRAALECGLPTVAVLAHGLNTIYPACHRSAAVDIIRSGGALVTEYASVDTIHKGNFPARNRIVAGMTDCTVVVESGAKGGAMLTARVAFAYNRDVFALPGRISDRYSAGCNSLLASQTASLLTDAEQLCTLMNWPMRSEEPLQPTLPMALTADEEAVCNYLTQAGQANLNDMAPALGINIARLMGLLVDMEFKGLLLSYPGGFYRLA